MKKLILIVPMLLIPLFSIADEVTHQLGNSGYAVREAMLAKASRTSPENYWKAARLQREARVKLEKRYIKEAMALSKEAEELAKKALSEATNGKYVREL